MCVCRPACRQPAMHDRRLLVAALRAALGQRADCSDDCEVVMLDQEGHASAFPAGLEPPAHEWEAAAETAVRVYVR